METNLFFLNNDLTLSKVVTDKNILTINHEHEMNGLVRADIELDLDYALEFLEDDIDYVGYYYADEFYLHKIISIEHDYHENVTYLAVHHIFFEDMSFGAYIEDLRPQNQDASFMLGQTIDVNTRWRTFVEDTTGRLSTNFYWESPQEVLDKVIDLFKLEYVPKIVFDGKNIQAFHLEVARKIGNPEYKRIDYNSKILELKHEMDYSEIVTKLIPHGKGEEVGDGYGRRINIEDVEYNKDGIKSPKGSLYLEDTNKTALYGNDGQTARVGRVVFEDVTNPTELARLAAEHYEEISQPKMLFSAKVSDIGTPNIGDTIVITRREYGIAYKARVMKIKVDLLNLSEAEIELGDYEFFQGSKVEKKQQQMNSEAIKRNGSLLQQAKDAWNEWFNSLKADFKADFEQAKIDTFALIEAERLAMQTLLDDKLNEFNDEYYALVDEAYRQAEENYARIEQEINTAVDTTRNEIEQDYTNAVEQAKRYAEEQSKAHANAVEIKLDTVTGSHAGMLADLQSNVMNIDEFIGQRDKTLQQILDEERQTLEQKIEIYNKNYPNLVVGSTLENIDGFEPYQTSQIELKTEESLNYIRVHYDPNRSVTGYLFPDTVYLEQGNTYTLGVDFRSDEVIDLDYIYFMSPYNNVALTPLEQLRDLSNDGKWHRYYFTFEWKNTTRNARLMMATSFSLGDTTKGWFDTRQVHLYKGNVHNIPWTPSPSDNAQVVSQLLYEIRQLEDGMKTLATKTDLDLVTGRVEQFTNEFTSTSEQLSSKLQNFDDVLGTNGSHFTQIAEQVQSKVWLNDVTNINPNLIPFADTSDKENLKHWYSYSGSIVSSVDSFGEMNIYDNEGSIIAVASSDFEVVKDEDMHFSVITRTSVSWGTAANFRYIYLMNKNGSNQIIFPTSYETIDSTRTRVNVQFKPNFTGGAYMLIGSYKFEGVTSARFSFKEPKLERGTERTPFLNAFSNIEQLANKIALQVQDLDGEFLTQSDIQVKAGYVQIGSQQIGDEQFASIFRVSPKSIDAITDNLNLSGNLNVKGQITTIAIDAIEGNFSRLFATEIDTVKLTAKNINANAIGAQHLWVDQALVNKLSASSIFSNMITTKALNAIDVNAGRVRASILEADVITGTHLAVGTSMINKLFATSGRIDQLITKNHFVTNVKAMSIEAVEGQFSSLMTRYLNANYIDVNYINGKNAWFESMYTKNALIEKLVAQHVFANGVRAIEITSNQLNIRTLHDKLKSVEGGLTIYGPDGRVLINNSILRASFDVQIMPSYSSANIDFTGLNYYTSSSSWQTINFFYTEFKGSKLLVSWAVGLQSGHSASEYAEVQTRGFGGNNPIGTASSRRFVTEKGGTAYYNQTINLGVPDYSTIQGYLEFRRSPTGVSKDNTVYARVLRVSMID